LIEWQNLDPFTLLAFVLSFLGFVFTALLLNSFIMPFPLSIFTNEQSYYFIYYKLFTSGTFWFCNFLTVLLGILPDIVLKIIENLHEKRFCERLSRETKQSLQTKSKEQDSKITETTMVSKI
jgi:hypothetical protein